MGGIQGPDSNRSGVDPASISQPADEQQDTGDSRPQPSSRASHPVASSLPATGKPGRREGASFKATAAEPEADAGQQASRIAQAAARQRRDLAIREEGSNLVYLGFSPDQIDEIMDARAQSGDALTIFTQMPQVLNALQIDSHSHDPMVAEQQDQLREKMVDLVKAGGADALEALRNAYFNSEQNTIGELCDHLTALGSTFGHSYTQLKDISLRNADALQELRDVHWMLWGFFTEEEQPRRVKQLGLLAERGGVEPLRIIKGIGGWESYSSRKLEAELTRLLRISGVKQSEIDPTVSKTVFLTEGARHKTRDPDTAARSRIDEGQARTVIDARDAILSRDSAAHGVQFDSNALFNVLTALARFGYQSSQLVEVHGQNGIEGLQALCDAHVRMHATMPGVSPDNGGENHFDRMVEIATRDGGVGVLKAMAQHWPELHFNVSLNDVFNMARQSNGADLLRSKAEEIYESRHPNA